MKDIDTTKVMEIIRQAAETEIIPRYKRLKAEEIREKGPGDLVTVADEAAEAFLSRHLSDILPGSVVVGEEGVAKNPRTLDLLKEKDKPVWVIDPVDGTHNFSHGIDRFGILLSLVRSGETLFGFAYDIPGQRMAVAEKGAGAWMDGKRLVMPQRGTDLSRLTCQKGGAKDTPHDPLRRKFKEVIVTRCSLFGFMSVYSGESDVIIHINKTTPWDHAANVLIVTESGGAVTVDDGKAYDPSFLGAAFLVGSASLELCQKVYAETFDMLREQAIPSAPEKLSDGE